MKYKFRAECNSDITELLNILPIGDMVSFNNSPLVEDMQFPDRKVELEFKELSLEGLRDIMRKITDGHVMLQTVMPIDEYTAVRNYKIN